MRDIQKYAKITIGNEAAPVRGPAPVLVATLPNEIRSMIEKGNLGPYKSRIQRWIEEGHTSLDIAAALLAITESGPEGEPDSAGRSRGDPLNPRATVHQLMG